MIAAIGGVSPGLMVQQELDPAIRHERAIDHHQRHGKQKGSPVGIRHDGEHLARMTLPEDVRREAGRHGQASETGEPEPSSAQGYCKMRQPALEGD
jgi:hypothetical protein